MAFRSIIFSSLLCLILLPMHSFAKIDYISLHEIESANNQPLSVKLNIVEKHQELRMKFSLIYKNNEIPLDYERLNDYMLRVKSTKNISDKATLLVYEFIYNAWRRTHTVKLFNASSSEILPPEVVKKTVQARPSKPTVTSVDCKIIRTPKETLWSIASRYKDKWNVDVFSAMIAIYKSNLNQFSKQHIGQLMASGVLTCPSTEMLSMMGEKAEMKAEFNQLNNSSVK